MRRTRRFRPSLERLEPILSLSGLTPLTRPDDLPPPDPEPCPGPFPGDDPPIVYPPPSPGGPVGTKL